MIMDPVILRGLPDSEIDLLVKRYKYNAEIPQTRKEILTIAERYYSKLDMRYSIELLYKVFYWYLYDRYRYRSTDILRKPSFIKE